MAQEDLDMSAKPATAIAPPATDLELVERVRAGDKRAMEPLIRRHNRSLYRTARAILRDDTEAEDAVQDAYIQAFRNLAAFRGESSFSTWLVRIAANEALMRRRRNVRRSEVIPINHESGELMMDEIAQDPAAGPENQAMSADIRRLLEQRIDALPDLYRAVFVMRAVEEMSVEETAAALDLPPATVRTRFFRARALLRSSLEHEVDNALLEVFAFDGERCDRIVAGVMNKWSPG
jgi:RNA polymerase sigma-70 factor (ECF subfamily)